jgi:hypothetical protein
MSTDIAVSREFPHPKEDWEGTVTDAVTEYSLTVSSETWREGDGI